MEDLVSPDPAKGPLKKQLSTRKETVSKFVEGVGKFGAKTWFPSEGFPQRFACFLE